MPRTKTTPSPKPNFSTVELDRFEPAAVLRVRRAKFLGAAACGGRVLMRFEVNPEDVDALAQLRAQAGPEVNAAELFSALLWVKTLAFTTRRDLRMEVDR